MKRIISFSLYGTFDKYIVGAIRNAESVNAFYPGWISRFYVGESIPNGVRHKLLDCGAEVVSKHGTEDASAMFWRFLAFSDPEVDYVIVRDCDSRFSKRETIAVSEWISEGKSFHIMRDHPYHNSWIMGGMWGGRTDALRNVAEIISKAGSGKYYGDDQIFLNENVYPLAQSSACVHDSFFKRERFARSFSSLRVDGSFVGEVFDEHDKPDETHREILKKFDNPIGRRFVAGKDLCRRLLIRF